MPNVPGGAAAGDLARQRQAVLARIDGAARAAGRDPRDVRLVAVTKHVSSETVHGLYDAGQRDFGENRVDELVRKVESFAAARPSGERPRWHFIGHLQRNKLRRAAPWIDVLHSVDSLRLLEALADCAQATGRSPELFFQVKLTAEARKGGFLPAELGPALERARALSLPVRGLMGMAPLADESLAGARDAFERLSRLSTELPAAAFAARPELSMGMSRDLELAIAAGADLVRVGSDLFRPLPPAPSTEPTPE